MLQKKTLRSEIEPQSGVKGHFNHQLCKKKQQRQFWLKYRSRKFNITAIRWSRIGNLDAKTKRKVEENLTLNGDMT